MHEGSHSQAQRFDPRQVTRPADVLLRYYGFIALCSLIAFPITMLVLYCKFVTLRYRFDDDGVSMSWGVLFRREINLTYRRIQDIHVTRGILQRWMGLATVSIQTASGSATPEMQIEGVLEYEALRDFLYAKMRGSREESAPPAGAAGDLDGPGDEALELLGQIASDLRAVNDALARGRAGADGERGA
ncbi:MAG: PH domain-containing protein [Planctomycetota bacterium]|nr:PH domain-containing protein [Planctomycetota bacterium]